MADRSSNEALIAHLKLEIEKLRRQLYGQRSERKERLLDQLELQLEEAEASATEDGKLWIYDVDGIETMAFTDFGLENLREIISDQIDRTA